MTRDRWHKIGCRRSPDYPETEKKILIINIQLQTKFQSISYHHSREILAKLVKSCQPDDLRSLAILFRLLWCHVCISFAVEMSPKQPPSW